MSKGVKTRMSSRDLQPHVHCCTVYNNQDIKTSQFPKADESIKCGVYVQWNVIQSKKEGNPVICSKMHEAAGH